MVAGCWLLVAGCRLLAVSRWLLVGCGWLLVVGCWLVPDKIELSSLNLYLFFIIFVNSFH
jgi:hypothetical protein